MMRSQGQAWGDVVDGLVDDLVESGIGADDVVGAVVESGIGAEELDARAGRFNAPPPVRS